MRRKAILLLASLSVSGVVAVAQEGMPERDLEWPAKSCLQVIEAKRWATDCQDTLVYRNLFWEGAYDVLPDGTRRASRDAQLNGPCPKYRTFLREIDEAAIQDDRQRVSLKAITTRVATDGRYSGDYSVAKVTYVCELRDEEWRIHHRKIHSAEWFVNQKAADAFERTGGWDGKTETAR